MWRRFMIPLSVGLIFIAFLGGLLVRYNGPTSVIRSYLQNTYDNDFANALRYVCPGEAGKNLRSYLEAQLQGVEADQQLKAQGFGDAGIPSIHIDLSHVTFAVQEESWTSATVSYNGVATVTSGQVATTTYKIAPHGSRPVRANGLWWCVSDY